MDMISGLRYQAEKLRKEQEAKAKAKAVGEAVDGDADATDDDAAETAGEPAQE
ncbi:MAG: hypothetical protein U0W40_03310 [Acidimicrobiia bacterium]